ncbi:MAG: hypothetical protein ABF868_01700 [Sporolactobacillus sp.]
MASDNKPLNSVSSPQAAGRQCVHRHFAYGFAALFVLIVVLLAAYAFFFGV